MNNHATVNVNEFTFLSILFDVTIKIDLYLQVFMHCAASTLLEWIAAQKNSSTHYESECIAQLSSCSCTYCIYKKKLFVLVHWEYRFQINADKWTPLKEVVGVLWA